MEAIPAGYAALIGAYGIRVPLPRILTATGDRHRLIEKDGWRIYSPRHAPKASLEGHLTFALKHEGLDLAVLKRLFDATGPAPIEALVKAKPTGAYARRVWFLYEWLTGRRLDLPNADRGAYAPVVDSGSPIHGPSRNIVAAPGEEQPARHAGILSLGIPHRDSETPCGHAVASAGSGGRRCGPERPAGAYCSVPAAEGFQVQALPSKASIHRRTAFKDGAGPSARPAGSRSTLTNCCACNAS